MFQKMIQILELLFFDFMKCKLAIKNELQQLTNEGEKLFPKNMSPYNLSKYKIKDNISSLIPYLNKDFKLNELILPLIKFQILILLIALIPLELIPFFNGFNKNVSQPSPKTKQWTWQRPIKIIRHNALKII
jgi:hypothetical protein